MASRSHNSLMTFSAQDTREKIDLKAATSQVGWATTHRIAAPIPWINCFEGSKCRRQLHSVFKKVFLIKH
jgi:hypothetical protein